MSAHVLFPLRLDERGRTATGTDPDYLRGLVEQVLFTRPGERVDRPEFGSGLAALLFEPLHDDLAAVTETVVRTSLQEALAGLIRVDDVAVDTADSAVTVTVAFTPLARPGEQVSVALRLAAASGGVP
jgi:phage baseplate assembly protein W